MITSPPRGVNPVPLAGAPVPVQPEAVLGPLRSSESVCAVAEFASESVMVLSGQVQVLPSTVRLIDHVKVPLTWSASGSESVEVPTTV